MNHNMNKIIIILLNKYLMKVNKIIVREEIIIIITNKCNLLSQLLLRIYIKIKQSMVSIK